MQHKKQKETSTSNENIIEASFKLNYFDQEICIKNYCQMFVVCLYKSYKCNLLENVHTKFSNESCIVMLLQYDLFIYFKSQE